MKSNLINKRDSNFELLRIITMFVIVAHHYVVNSGLMDLITKENVLSGHSIFYLLFGFGGKMGINVFVLITGYFMCKSQISVRKYVKILVEILFYNVVIYFIFLLTGYTTFSVKDLIKTIIPFYYIGTEFLSTYLVFFWFIPFLNILIQALNRRWHMILIGLGILSGSFIQTFFFMPNAFTYMGWFMVLYFIAAYIRIYPNQYTDSLKWSRKSFCFMLIISYSSIIVSAIVWSKTDHIFPYYFVTNSNKFIGILMAVTMFLYFKNMKIPYFAIINKISSAVFGVLLIHANSDAMRSWMWRDVCKNVSMFDSNWFIVHAIVTVILIYVICTIIDLIRINVLEKYFMEWFDKHEWERKINRKFNKLVDKILDL